MRFRTITAPTMQAAMSELRERLGPGAIILGTECAKDGRVTIRAAAEHIPDHALSTTSQAPLKHKDLTAQCRVDDTHAIRKALLFHRAPEVINNALLHTTGALNMGDPAQALTAALDTRYCFAPLPVQPVRPVLLIGPAGAGKTITAAKLAARSVLAGHKPVLITTDLVRTGGAEQLAACAAAMNAPFHRAANEKELVAIVEAQAEPKSCFIDTTGASPYNIGDLEMLRKLVMAVDCDPVLVLPAGGDAVEACEIVNIFSGLGARGLIITKLDVTRRLGSILGALETAAMILHHVGISPFVANGLAPIASAGLARLLLEDSVEQEFFSELEQAAQ